MELANFDTSAIEFLDYSLPTNSTVNDFTYIEFNVLGGQWLEFKGQKIPVHREAFARLNVDGIEYCPMVIGYMISTDGRVLRLLTSDAYRGTQTDDYTEEPETAFDSTNDPATVKRWSDK